ncbi:Lrp/AsnC family transcriptional regulator [Candidatus Bathyarchaeota archaeon]|nr:Lrp/AsnC family transcriptional regulator [Candidatus Bathyarchaeota archaeon]
MLKYIEAKMLSELVKNSRRSDRELAKAIGTSQPTATRIRTKLEKEGFVKEYTAIPNLSKIGYSIIALNILKLNLKMTPAELQAFKKAHFDALAKNSNAVFMAKSGMGLGYDAVVISLHPTYSSCDQFRSVIRESMSANISDMNTFLVNLEEEKTGLPLTFSLLANSILTLYGKDEK